MELKNIKKEKEKLASDIEKQLKEFEKKYNVQIDFIDYSKQRVFIDREKKYKKKKVFLDVMF